MIKQRMMNEIKELFEKRFCINASNLKWQKFIEFCYQRQKNHKEPAETFVKWALSAGFDPIYWTPEKMQTLYPRAFAQEKANRPREDFVEPLPNIEEPEFAPMPKEAKVKRDLY